MQITHNYTTQHYSDMQPQKTVDVETIAHSLTVDNENSKIQWSSRPCHWSSWVCLLQQIYFGNVYKYYRPTYTQNIIYPSQLIAIRACLDVRPKLRALNRARLKTISVVHCKWTSYKIATYNKYKFKM